MAPNLDTEIEQRLLVFTFQKKGERRDLNPRMVESQSTALTTWPRSPRLGLKYTTVFLLSASLFIRLRENEGLGAKCWASLEGPRWH